MCDLDPKWVATVGLLFDMAGATFLAIGLFTTKRKAAELGGSYWHGESWEEDLSLPPVKDRLRQSRNAVIGLPLLCVGFALQIVAQWLPV